jgi:hypothetical protein
MHACTDHVYTYVQVMRINLFSGVRFSLARGGRATFPMTSVALRRRAVTNVLTRALAVVASITIAGVLVTTMYRAFVRKDLFPDVSIAVTQRPKASSTRSSRTSTPLATVSRTPSSPSQARHRRRIRPHQRRRVTIGHGAWAPQSRAVGHRRPRHSSDIFVGPLTTRHCR